MKKSFKARVAPVMVVALCAIFGFMTDGCDQPDDINNKETPVSADFTITGLSATFDGKPKIVSIKPKTGKSQGAITVYYDGITGTVYPKSTNAPSLAGKYDVTFDVAEAEGFNEAKDLKAGTLTISVKTSVGSERENEDDNYENDDNKDDYYEDDNTEEIDEPLSLIDFEDKVWTGSGYKRRTVRWKGYEWSVSGVVNASTTTDRKEGKRSIRFRGSDTADKGDNTNRIELMDYLTNGIKSISFDYASFSDHNGGTIILYYQKEDEDWAEAGRVTNIPEWIIGGGKMLNAEFEINAPGKVRFKIEKLYVGSGSISANVDNIVINTY